jgi:hypothetical protein
MVKKIKNQKNVEYQPLTVGLKNCPFCGSDKVGAGHINGFNFAGSCINCFSHGPIVSLPKEREFESLNHLFNIMARLARILWNRRK